MENEIRILKNKTNKKYNDSIDFIIEQGILKGWVFTIHSVLILKNDVLITLILNHDVISISAKDFIFSIGFHNRIFINHLEIQKYISKGE